MDFGGEGTEEMSVVNLFSVVEPFLDVWDTFEVYRSVEVIGHH